MMFLFGFLGTLAVVPAFACYDLYVRDVPQGPHHYLPYMLPLYVAFLSVFVIGLVHV